MKERIIIEIIWRYIMIRIWRKVFDTISKENYETEFIVSWYHHYIHMKINSFLLNIENLKIIFKKNFISWDLLNYHILFFYFFDIASIKNKRRISSILNWFSYDFTLINLNTIFRSILRKKIKRSYHTWS